MSQRFHILLFVSLFHCYSCSVLERASSHGLEDGQYQWQSSTSVPSRVYLDVGDDQIVAYTITEGRVEAEPALVIPLGESDSFCLYPHKFRKQSLDIDFTSNLLKFHPSTAGRPSQLITDFNAALYAGWRHDTYFIESKQDMLNKCHYKIYDRGFDFGLFAGPGTAAIGPFSTKGKVEEEYSGFTVQYGAAGFLETSFASFGLSMGFDHLLSKDRNVWIYNDKLWVGFIVGIALN